MAKMTLPSANLDLTLEAGKQKAAIAVATGKNTDFIVPVDQLRVLPGFNVRVRETDDYRQHVEGLKQSIRENGYYANKPLAGFIAKDSESGDDVIFVTDGHTRLEAVQEINAEALNDGESIPALPVSLKPADSTIADLTIALVQENTGRPLTPYEMGIVVQRLANMKGDDNQPLYTKADIARRLSVTERYIDDLNVLVGAPAKVRNAVLEGSVSSTLAIQELRRDPKKAEERLLAAVTQAKAKGKAKATRKDVGGVKMQRVRGTVSLATGDTMADALKALAAQIREVVPHKSKADGDAMTVDGTISFVVEVPAPPAEPKPAKAKAPAKAPAKAKAASKPAKAAATAKKPAKAPAAAPEVASEDEDSEPLAALPPAVQGNANVADPDDI
jgi:ParB family chromosome partitioning protein